MSASLSCKPSDGRDCRVEVFVDITSSRSVSLHCVHPSDTKNLSSFSKSLRPKSSHTFAPNSRISAGPTTLTNLFFSGAYCSPSKTPRYLERYYAAGSSHWTRCPLGQSGNTRRPKRTFSKQSHARQLDLTPPSRRRRTGPPPACHPLDGPTEE